MYEHVEKKKENKRAVSNYVPQRKSCFKEGFEFYNRPEAKQSLQFKGIIGNFTDGMPIQMMVIIKGADGKNRTEEDDYELQDGEEYDFDAMEEYEEQKREAEILKAKQEKQLAEAQRLQLLEEREARLKRIPLVVKRSDRNFREPQNSRKQGKAHITERGLAPAGRVSVTTKEHLDQKSIHKGESDLISFTGPNPDHGGQKYGGENAEILEVKARKIARAKEKGKMDAQNLEVITSKEILDQVHDERLHAYARKDDEHQIRVKQPNEGELLVIPKRFLKGAGFADQHDSDSEDDH